MESTSTKQWGWFSLPKETKEALMWLEFTTLKWYTVFKGSNFLWVEHIILLCPFVFCSFTALIWKQTRWLPPPLLLKWSSLTLLIILSSNGNFVYTFVWLLWRKNRLVICVRKYRINFTGVDHSWYFHSLFSLSHYLVSHCSCPLDSWLWYFVFISVMFRVLYTMNLYMLRGELEKVLNQFYQS